MQQKVSPLDNEMKAKAKLMRSSCSDIVCHVCKYSSMLAGGEADRLHPRKLNWRLFSCKRPLTKKDQENCRLPSGEECFTPFERLKVHDLCSIVILK